jgi:ribose transport system substrate-binding protein
MKKLLALLMVAALTFTCVAAIGEGVKASPLAGLAVKEDGTPYKLGYILNETSSGWMSTSYGYTKALWEGAGGEFMGFVSNYNSQYESDSIDQLMELGVDAILVHPGDSYAIAPKVQQAMDAGFPVFAMDMGVEGAVVDSYVHQNQVLAGAACAQAVMDYFSKDNPANVLIIAGGLEQNGAQQRQKGFEDAVAGCDYVKIVFTVDTGWSSDKAYSGIQTLFESNPEINCVYSHSDFMMQGIIEGLRAQGKLIPAGTEGHIYLTSIDADSLGLKTIADGFIDSDAELNSAMHSVVAINVILGHLHGLEYQSDILLDTIMVNKDNMNDDARWGGLAAKYGDFVNWPVLQQNYYDVVKLLGK